MRRAVALLVGTLLSGACVAQTTDAPRPLLESDDFARMKNEYRACVLQKGADLLAAESFDIAMRYAPVVCRRGLLQIKRYMLESAFKVDVMDELLASIAEGVEIDLANALLEIKLRENES